MLGASLAGAAVPWAIERANDLHAGPSAASSVEAPVPSPVAEPGAPVVGGISIERGDAAASTTPPEAAAVAPTTTAAPAPAAAATDTATATAAAAATAATAATATATAGATAGAADVATGATGLDGLRTQVLAQISFDWQERLPGWTIEFMPARNGYRGSTFPAKQLIRIYQRDGLSVADYVHTTAHELGHAVDVTLLDDDDRDLWNLTRDRDADAGWWVASGEDDFASGAGDWAECFAWSQLPSGRFYSTVGPVPTAEQLDVLAAIVG